MGVPDFQSLMLPLLRLAADGKEHSVSEARARLASEFRLSEGEQNELLPSGRQSRFGNRVAWAKVYLEQGGLLDSPGRGHFKITERGREVLKAPPERISIKFLEQYPEFVEFRAAKGKPEVPQPGPVGTGDTETPEEALEAAHARITATLASEVTGSCKGKSPGVL